MIARAIESHGVTFTRACLRRARDLARAYRTADGRGGARERSAVSAALAHRALIRATTMEDDTMGRRRDLCAAAFGEAVSNAGEAMTLSPMAQAGAMLAMEGENRPDALADAIALADDVAAEARTDTAAIYWADVARELRAVRAEYLSTLDEQRACARLLAGNNATDH